VNELGHAPIRLQLAGSRPQPLGLLVNDTFAYIDFNCLEASRESVNTRGSVDKQSEMDCFAWPRAYRQFADMCSPGPFRCVVPKARVFTSVPGISRGQSSTFARAKPRPSRCVSRQIPRSAEKRRASDDATLFREGYVSYFFRIGLYPSATSLARVASASLMSANGPTCTWKSLSAPGVAMNAWY